MKTPTLYNMIVQAEDRSRTVVEVFICALLILSAVALIASAVVQSVGMPAELTTCNPIIEYCA